MSGVALGVGATLATEMLVVASVRFLSIALSRRQGTECLICDHLKIDIDERRTVAYIWTRKAWHKVWWRTRKWHREGEAAHRAKWARR